MVDIKINLEDLNDPKIDEIIQVERSLNFQSSGEFVEDVKTPFYMIPAFYYAVATCIVSFAVWSISEQYYSDEEDTGIPFLSDYLLFGPVAGVISMTLGITYGAANRNLMQSLTLGISGLGIGLAITLITTFIAEILFGVTTAIAISMARDTLTPENTEIKGLTFFVLMCGRGLAWSVVSCGAGLSLGILLKSKKMILNGLAGGIVGGALGGILFDPVGRFISGNMEDGTLSRAVGIIAVGTLTGLFVGIFESINKESWLLMLKGPLAGKQFVIFKSPIFLGSAPKCEIYLFKDPDIEPKHVRITTTGKKYLMEDLNSDQGTFVNGRKLTSKYVLQPEDVITLGETILKYQEKHKR